MLRERRADRLNLMLPKTKVNKTCPQVEVSLTSSSFADQTKEVSMHGRGEQLLGRRQDLLLQKKKQTSSAAKRHITKENADAKNERMEKNERNTRWKLRD